MSKKVLIISSSPRKGGNSDTLCDRFAEGAVFVGNKVEKVFLKDKKIGYCTGCGLCNNGERVCSQKDDMAELINKMIEADVIVMATPVYFYTMCGQMKTFIDRCCVGYTEINNKEFYFIVTAADNNQQAMERTIEEFRGFTYCLEGAIERGVIYGINAWKIGDIEESQAMAQAFEMGRFV